MQSTVLVTTVLVASLVLQPEVAGQPLDDELLEAELSEPWLSSRFLESVPHHHSHHRHGHHHHGRHHRAFRGWNRDIPDLRSHRTALAMAAPSETVATSSADLPPEPADDVTSLEGDSQVGIQSPVLSSRHPAVERALSSMGDEMQEWRVRKQAASDARKRLQGIVSDAASHMNDLPEKVVDIAEQEARINATQNKLHSLEAHEKSLEGTHDQLITSLHRIMDPKVESAEERLGRKQGIVQKMREEVETWQEKDARYKAAAIQLLEDRKVAQQGVVQSEQALADVQRELETAQKNLKSVARQAEEEVEAYRYVKSKYMAVVSKEKLGEEEVGQAESSVRKLRGALDMEQRRIDQAMEIGKGNLQGKIRQLESGAQKTGEDLETMRQEYAKWEQSQRGRAEQVAQAQATTNQLSDAFREQQDQLLDTATDKVAKEAMDSSDWAWGEWPDDD